jgi:hypothetical protein
MTSSGGVGPKEARCGDGRGRRRVRRLAPAASIAVFVGAGACALTTDWPAPVRAEQAAGASRETGAQGEVRRRFIPRVRLSVALVSRGRTRIDKLGVAGAPGGAVVRLACSGRGCPSRDRLSLNPPEPARFAKVMIGRRLSAGAKLVVSTLVAREIRSSSGPSFSLQLEYVTEFVMRRGALPRRADSCEASPDVLEGDCIDPSIVGLFRVQGPVTKVARLWVTEVGLDAVFRVSCRGRSCPSGVGYHPLPRHGVDLTGAFRGERLAPGTKITVGYVTPDKLTLIVPGVEYLPPTSCAATEWTIRRGLAPKRIDLGPYEGEDPNAVRQACSQPFL